jgi:hypothetical protein
VPAGRWFSGSFPCSPAFAAVHWRYIGAAIAADDVGAESEVVEFREEDLWTNYRYQEDLEAAMRNLVHEIVRSLGIKGKLYDIVHCLDFNTIVQRVADDFGWLASTAVFRKIVANEFDMPEEPPARFP